MTILLMLLLFELEITVLNCNQFSPLVTLINDYFFLVTNISVSESSTKFSGLPHVTDPQLHDGMHVISAFASSCGTGFASALQQLHSKL